MKHMASGTIAFIGVLALAGCYSYNGEAINNDNYKTVQGTPNFLVVKVGDSTQVIARLVNDNNNGAITDYTVGSVGAGILVHQNLNYRPVFNPALDTLEPTGPKTAQQYFVVGTAVGRYTFTLTPTMVNTGISGTITAIVTPRDLGAGLNRTTAAPGDTVIITAPAGTVFGLTGTNASVVTFTTGTVAVIARAADSTTITIVIGGGVTGPATITKVGTKVAPSLAPVTILTTNTLTTPPQAQPTLAPTTGPAGTLITLTAPANNVFLSNSAVTFPTGAISAVTRSADSTRLTFLAGPGVTGVATVTNVALVSAPTLPATTQTSTNTLTTPTLTVAPTTVSSAAPGIGSTITVALGGGLRFLGTSKLFIGGTEAGIQSVSADSSTATVMPMVGSTGNITYTNIALSFLNSVPLALPGDKTVTVGAAFTGVAFAGTGAIATAPVIAPPPAGRSFVYADATGYVASAPCAAVGGDGCRFYSFTTSAVATWAVEMRWTGGADMGFYRMTAAGGSPATIADAHGQPDALETGSMASLAVGSYIIALAYYGPCCYGAPLAAPAAITFRITRP